MAIWVRLPGSRLATSMTVAVRLKRAQTPSSRLTSPVDLPVFRPGKLLDTAAKIRTIQRLSSIARSTPARRSRLALPPASMRGRGAAGREARCVGAGPAPPLRGTALLGRALVNQLLGDHPAALTDAVAALAEWRTAPADWVARALIGMAAALEADSPGLAAEYWQVAAMLAGRGQDP